MTAKIYVLCEQLDIVCYLPTYLPHLRTCLPTHAHRVLDHREAVGPAGHVCQAHYSVDAGACRVYGLGVRG